ncbi:alpha/beta family hydrolase [Bradyrhizobium sp.]|uniref:alpha/beta hydrolase family protein n=1 Tax=Bradyrhizobium sp. TaxID=376 RepID=UPI0026174155|nr:alpha/beta family hydrolase [Bradyrhizobium sp.]
MAGTRELKLGIERVGTVSALLTEAAKPRACFVFAHGAGAGMRHSFMEQVAAGLADRGVTTLRFNFPYMEQGSRRPDAPGIAHAAIRAAVAEASRLCPNLPLIAGGKSFGGRMTSQAQAKAPLPGVRGIAFFGFPLHLDGKPSAERADHLAGVEVPMLFLQGTRDKLADISLLKTAIERLGAKAMLHVVEGADHSFLVLKKSGRSNAETMEDILDAFATWLDRLEIAQAE